MDRRAGGSAGEIMLVALLYADSNSFRHTIIVVDCHYRYYIHRATKQKCRVYAGRTDATAIEKKTTLLKRFQYLSRLLMRFHDMGSTEAQLLQGTYYSFGVATLLDEVMRIGVDTLTEDKLVIDIFAEFNNFLAALVCRNPMLQGKVLVVCVMPCCVVCRESSNALFCE